MSQTQDSNNNNNNNNNNTINNNKLLMEILAFVWKLLCIFSTSFVSLFSPKAKKDVKGQVALVTGAASGLGRLISLKLSKLGCNVVLVDVNEQGLAQVAQEIKEQGGEAHHFTCDLSQREKIYQMARNVQKQVGDVDILINNAGIVTGKSFLESPDNMIEKTFQVNTIAHFWTTKSFLPAMLRNGRGHIVTIASTAGTCGVKTLADYCASKFGAFGFDESLRQELSSTPVKTTCVCPYFINTGMFDGVKTRFPLLMPILEPEYAVDKIVEAIQTDQEVLVMPKFCWLAPLMRFVLPVKAFDEVASFLGLSDAMKDFVGRK